MSSTIYSRIVARLEPPVLQRQCTLIFDDELQGISAELREVAAAYARLHEVREAVATLENGRVGVSRSASLMETVGSTVQVQEDLMHRMRLVERALKSRSAGKLDSEERKASETKTEERGVEDQTKARRAKRRRRDSTSDDADEQNLMREEEREEEEQPGPASSRKKSENKKAKKTTTQHESPASSSSASASASSESSSESESETERDPTRRAVAEVATTRSSKRLSSAEWIGLVIKASTAAQRLTNAKQRPAVSDVTLAVDKISVILETPQVLSGRAVVVSKITRGHFDQLMPLTIGLLHRLGDDPVVVSLTNTILGGIYRLIARDPRARTGDRDLPDLRQYISELIRIREKTTKPVPPQFTPPLEAKEKATDWSQWSDRVLKLHRVAVRASRSGKEVKFAKISSFVDQFRDTLNVLTSTNVANMKLLVRNKLLTMVEFAARTFQSPSVTKQFVPLLDKVVVAIDRVVKLHKKFKNLRRHSQKLQEIRSKIADRDEPQKPATDDQQPMKASKKKTPALSKQPKSKASKKPRKSKRGRRTAK